MFNEFPSIYLPHKIITSGINNYKILKKIFSNVSIIGSSRSIKNSNRIFKKNNTCLVLPEGIESECIILLNFVINLAFKMPEINFIFRLHPLTNVTKIKKMLKKKTKRFNFDNIEISAKSLSFDLNRSSVCLYRGSTSSIAAVQSGLIPIYYNYRSDLNIDPMFQINKKMRYAKNLEDFKTILNMKKQKKELILKKILRLANNYFVKFDHKILNKILSY